MSPRFDYDGAMYGEFWPPRHVVVPILGLPMRAWRELAAVEASYQRILHLAELAGVTASSLDVYSEEARRSWAPARTLLQVLEAEERRLAVLAGGRPLRDRDLGDEDA